MLVINNMLNPPLTNISNKVTLIKKVTNSIHTHENLPKHQSLDLHYMNRDFTSLKP